jgi:hypothetical protein
MITLKEYASAKETYDKAKIDMEKYLESFHPRLQEFMFKVFSAVYVGLESEDIKCDYFVDQEYNRTGIEKDGISFCLSIEKLDHFMGDYFIDPDKLTDEDYLAELIKQEVLEKTAIEESELGKVARTMAEAKKTIQRMADKHNLKIEYK